jgi:hypothetical protein
VKKRLQRPSCILLWIGLLHRTAGTSFYEHKKEAFRSLLKLALLIRVFTEIIVRKSSWDARKFGMKET